MCIRRFMALLPPSREAGEKISLREASSVSFTRHPRRGWWQSKGGGLLGGVAAAAAPACLVLEPWGEKHASPARPPPLGWQRWRRRRPLVRGDCGGGSDDMADTAISAFNGRESHWPAGRAGPPVPCSCTRLGLGAPPSRWLLVSRSPSFKTLAALPKT